MPFSANSRNAVGTSNLGTSNFGISNLGISNFGASKAGALIATGFGFDFGVAAVLGVFSAMTVILRLGRALFASGPSPSTIGPRCRHAHRREPVLNVLCRAVD